MTNIFRFLEEKKIAYAVVKGVYSEEALKKEDIGFREDLDIVLDCNKEDVFSFFTSDRNFKYLENNSFLDISDNIRVDLYFRTLNVGYYHFLKVSHSSFKSKEVSEIEYVIYQILDPLLKFSKYHERHKYRLSKYLEKGISNDLEISLKQIIGSKLTVIVLNKISASKYSFSRVVIAKCKFRMLFINGNFVRMIKSRVFKWK